jgi:hypothetical protein
MKLHLCAALALLITLCTAGCSTVNVEQRPGVNFSRYRTFDFAQTQVKTQDTQNPLYQSSIAEATIQQAIKQELAERGITQVQRGRPDFFVSTHVYVEEAERVVSNPPVAAGFAYPYSVFYRGALLPVNYGYWYSPRYYNTGTHTEKYQEGTMVIDMIDSRTNNLVWRGSVANPVNDPARFGKQFAEEAKDIIEKFPVKKID